VKIGVVKADMVIGAVLIPGARAPRLLTREMLGHMRPGSVVVDVAIDQGGCFATSKPTTHSDPTYVLDDVVHYCVANMPGAVPITSTIALTNVTLPYVQLLAEAGTSEALRRSAALARGVNVMGGKLTYQPVAESLGLEHVPLSSPAVTVAA
jgi:alanine dehydrogenase